MMKITYESVPRLKQLSDLKQGEWFVDITPENPNELYQVVDNEKYDNECLVYKPITGEMCELNKWRTVGLVNVNILVYENN